MTNTSTRTDLSIPREVFLAFLHRTFPDLPEDIKLHSLGLSYSEGRPINLTIEYDHREEPMRLASPLPLTAIGDGAVDVETEEVISEDPPALPDLTLVEPDDDTTAEDDPQL